jgi:hypothetical protein
MTPATIRRGHFIFCTDLEANVVTKYHSHRHHIPELPGKLITGTVDESHRCVSIDKRRVFYGSLMVVFVAVLP